MMSKHMDQTRVNSNTNTYKYTKLEFNMNVLNYCSILMDNRNFRRENEQENSKILMLMLFH